MRYAPESAFASAPITKPPFIVRGAANVILETVKRGDDDVFTSDDLNSAKATTIVLRLYEAFGGHAQAFLRISDAFKVAKVYASNLLEENVAELNIFRAQDSEDDVEVKLDFRGFEVKTVKLGLGDVKIPSERRECVAL